MKKKVIIYIVILLTIIAVVGVSYYIVTSNNDDKKIPEKKVDKNGPYPDDWEGYVDDKGAFISKEAVEAAKSAAAAKAFIEKKFPSEKIELVEETAEAYFFKSTINAEVTFKFEKVTFYLYSTGIIKTQGE